MKYRDDLEAAQNRIRELENRVEELQDNSGDAVKAEAEANERKGAALHAANQGRGGCFYAGTGISSLVLLIVGSIVLGGRACVACNSEVTDPALAAAKACPAAREALGDDLHWSVIGCSNYESQSGGDPINAGCHSSATFYVPIAGTKDRGSYQFSSSQAPGKRERFDGGRITMSNGTSISISSDGTCK